VRGVRSQRGLGRLVPHLSVRHRRKDERLLVIVMNTLFMNCKGHREL